MRHTRLAATALVLLSIIAAAGCTSPKDAGAITSVGGVTNTTGGDVHVRGADGVRVSADAPNTTLRIGLGGNLGLAGGALEACVDECKSAASGLKPGTLVAEADLVSGAGLKLNANGPARDASIDVWAHGSPSGEQIAWREAKQEFEVSRGLDAFGNVTARHHVGTVTSIIVQQASGPSVVSVATAAMEGNEATVFLRGSANLTNGSATIEFPISFRVLVGNGPITAQVTPTSDGAPLFVKERTSDHIVVRAMGGATGAESFDYFVQATRAASEDFATVLPTS